MSFSELKINPLLLKELYGKVLVESHPVIRKDPSIPAIPYLGNNEKNILILVNDSHATFVKDDDLQLLIGILGACNLTLADTAIVNLNLHKINYDELVRTLFPGVILLFGIDQGEIELPLQFPLFQIQQYDNRKLLAAPPLNMLAADVSLKKELWQSLKQLFLA